MGRINLKRVVIGGILAGVIFFIGDGIVHGALLSGRWAAQMAALGKSGGGDIGQRGFAYFLCYDLLKGWLAVALYAAMRPRFGAGPTTALLAGLLVWALVIPVPMIGLLPMEFFSAGLVILWAVYALVPMILGTVAGAWLYREA